MERFLGSARWLLGALLLLTLGLQGCATYSQTMAPIRETLVQGDVPAGEHRLHWSAQGLASGIYFCRMETNGFSETIRMMYTK